MSFNDLLKTATATKSTSTVSNISTDSIDNEDYGIATLELSPEESIAAYTPEGWTETIAEAESWTRIEDRYDWYDEYSDNNLSTINDEKQINLNEKQINITQEENSQFIPFEMSRYADGFDLSTTTITIHYDTKDNYHGVANPVNVQYSSDKLRFAWLVDANVTHIAGVVKFEIHATGVNSKQKAYVWKSRSNDKLNVLQSLCTVCDEIIDLDDSWVQDLVERVAENVAQQIAEAQVGEQVAQAEAAAADAKTTLNEVNATADSIESNVETSVYNKVVTELENYYTKDEVDTLFENFDISSQLEGLEGRVETLENELENFDGLANLDVSYDTNTRTLTLYNGEEEIKSVILNSDPSAEWVTAYDAKVDGKISDAVSVVQTDLDTYKETTNADLQSIHENIDNLPTTLETDYYNKEATDALLLNKADTSALTSLSTTVGQVETTANTNKENISTISEKVVELEESISGINTDPTLTYDVNYDATTGLFKFHEMEGDAEPSDENIKRSFTITGGSGGGSSTATTVTIERITASPLVVTNKDKAIIKYKFTSVDSTGDDTGEGSAVWKVGSTIVATSLALQGDNEFDVTDYVSVGTQKITLTITDAAGTISVKNWTVQVVDIRLESSFNDTYTYPIGEVEFTYTPYGSIEKTVHFILDGEELESVTTSVSGIPMSYTLPSQTHGAHLLETYITASVNNSTIETEHIFKDILWCDETSDIPVIGCTTQNITALQYDNTNIVYTVYDPTTETPTVVLAVDGNDVSTLTLESVTNTWQYKSSDVGDHVLTITCGETVKTINVTIEKLDIDVTPVTANLAFDFNPVGYSNNDANRLWTNGTTSMTVSDNFDWVNGGYQIDENGDQYFCIKAGTSAEIDYQLFADDAKKNGKEFKLIFRTSNVAKPDATFLSCMDNTTDSDHIGIQMDVHEAYIYGQAGNLQLSYSEEDIVEFEFNISKNTEAIPMVMGYEDGVSTRPMVYDDSYNFTQNTPQIISLGSDDCDLYIYRFKVYNTSLTDRGILSNFIADARNAEEMIGRYNRNQIYDENTQLTPDILAEKCPWLRVYKISAPYFTNNKSDKVPNTTIQQIYKNGDVILDNWTAYNVMHSGQGTSSNNYGAAGRNLDFIMNKSGIDGVDPYIVLGDNTRTDKITLTRTSVPVAYLNAKVNIASANNLTNAMLANRYNEFNPYKRPFVRTAELSDAYTDEEIAAMTEEEQTTALAELQEKVDAEISYIKNTMEFHNCVIFIQETNDDLSTHREFADKNWHFYSMGNIGDSKKTDKTRLTDMNDKYECCVEIMDVELPLSDFPANTMYNAMGYTVDEKTEEKIYTWAKDENLGILYELIDGEYVLTEDTAVDLNKTYYVDILEHDDFSEDFTYGWRYIYEDGTDEENEEVFNYCKQKWIELYRFITTSTDEEFKAGIGNYFVLDSALYYVLFANRYCLTDNLAKNSFWHYGKTNEVDSDGNPIRKWDLTWGYDMDKKRMSM